MKKGAKMKIRSKALFEHLKASGVLHGTAEEIKKEKKEFRRRYQRHWKQKRKGLKQDIRISLSHKQIFDLKVRSIEIGISSTEYIKEVVLASLSNEVVIPNRHELESVFQSLGIIATLIEYGGQYPDWNAIRSRLDSAEGILANYLGK